MIQVKRSIIKDAGKGVFATRNINKHECLGEYKGVLMSADQYNKCQPDHTYIWQLVTDKDEIVAYIDAKDIKKSNWTRYVNCPFKKSQDNVEPIQKYFKMYYYAKRNIKKGEELFVWYGPDYGEELTGKREL